MKKEMKTVEEKLIEKCKSIIKFDVARICQPMKRMYLIIGFNRNTKDYSGQWIKNGEPINFDYVEEKVVASGDTCEELIASVKEYKRLSKMSWEEYFKTVYKVFYGSMTTAYGPSFIEADSPAEGKERNILNLYPADKIKIKKKKIPNCFF